MSISVIALAVFAATPLAAPTAIIPAASLQSSGAAGDLAAQPLAAGRAEEALVALQRASTANPDDAALLINLGIAYAHQGDDAQARSAFKAALACDDVVELSTADGTATDSRRLARKALRMLERGEFRPAGERGEQLTYRD